MKYVEAQAHHYCFMDIFILIAECLLRSCFDYRPYPASLIVIVPCPSLLQLIVHGLFVLIHGLIRTDKHLAYGLVLIRLVE